MIDGLVNGKERASLSILDRGLQFGDGLFETIAVVEGQPALWERHVERLLNSCRQLDIEPPDPALLRQESERLIDGRATCILKILVTRGISQRGYAVPLDVEPTRILQLFDWAGPETSEPLPPVPICRQRLGVQPGYAGLKHLNRLEQVLARREVSRGEGLMLDAEGFLVEGIASNLFLVQGNELHTPVIDRCGVAGVVRSLILDLALEMDRPARVRRIRPGELEGAEGIFLTSSLLGVRPVSGISGLAQRVRLTHHPVLEEASLRVFTPDG